MTVTHSRVSRLGLGPLGLGLGLGLGLDLGLGLCDEFRS